MPPPSDGLPDETYHRRRKRHTALATVAAVAGLAWICVRWRPSRVEIEGPSMAPTLIPGDWALTVPLRSPARGQIVVVEHPGRPGFEMVKRIVAGPGDTVGGRMLGPDEWWVEGDFRSSSTDSRAFGPVPEGSLRARVRLIYAPAARRRLL